MSSAGPPPLPGSIPVPEKRQAAITPYRLYDPKELNRIIGDYPCNNLKQNGVDIQCLQWVMPVTSIGTKAGNTIDGGYCAATIDGRFLVFRFTQKDGFRFASTWFAETSLSIKEQNGSAALCAALEGADCPIITVTVALSESVFLTTLGDWFSFWQPGVISVFSDSDAISLGLVSVTRYSPGEDRIGPAEVSSVKYLLADLQNDGWKFFPDFHLPMNKCLRWSLTVGSLSLLIAQETCWDVFVVNEIPTSTSFSIIDRIAKLLPSELKANDTSIALIADSGMFSMQLGSSPQIERRILKQCNQSFHCMTAKTLLIFELAVCYDARILLISPSGEYGVVLLERADATAFSIFDKLKRHTDLLGDPESLWCVCLDEAAGLLATKVHFAENVMTIGEKAVYLDCILRIVVEKSSDALSRVTFDYLDGSTRTTRILISTEPIVYRLWEECDIRKAKRQLAAATTAELYRQYNETKKFNLLFVLFADIILLHRELELGKPLQATLEQTTLDPAKGPGLSKDAQEQVITKIFKLSVGLPTIKQKFEILASMYPYYWLHRDRQWLFSVFGLGETSKLISMEEKRLIPLVRREVRSIQSNISRALSEIEAAIRPLESVLVGKEVEKSGMARLLKYGPSAIQGVLGLGVLALGNTTMALRMLATSVTTGVIQSHVRDVLQDQAASMQIERSASTIFPWWQIFMRTLSISIYEAAGFIDDENETAMKRDRELLDICPPETRDQILANLNDKLRCRIVEERKNRFVEVLEGSGIRLASVVQDIENSVGPNIRQDIQAYIESISITHKNVHQGT